MLVSVPLACSKLCVPGVAQPAVQWLKSFLPSLNVAGPNATNAHTTRQTHQENTGIGVLLGAHSRSESRCYNANRKESSPRQKLAFLKSYLKSEDFSSAFLYFARHIGCLLYNDI